MTVYYILAFCFFFIHKGEANWKCDQLGNKGTVTITNQKVTVTEADKTTNILCRYYGKQIQEGKNVFAFYMHENKAGNTIGLATNQTFQGYNFKGCFYNGGLGHSSAVKTIFRHHFGDFFNYPNKDVKVTFAAEITNNKLKIYIKHHYTSLGLAYSNKQKKFPLFPTVWFKNNGEVTYEEVPSSSFDSISIPRKPLKVGGTYEITKLTENNVEKLELLKKCARKDINFKILNYGMADVQFDGIKPSVFKVEDYNKNFIATIDGSVGAWKCTGFSIKPQNECDQFVHNVLKNIKQLTYDNDHGIVLIGEENGCEKTFEGKMKTPLKFRPVKKNCDN